MLKIGESNTLAQYIQIISTFNQQYKWDFTFIFVLSPHIRRGGVLNTSSSSPLGPASFQVLRNTLLNTVLETTQVINSSGFWEQD